MCYNCGCALPKDPMGDERNITEKTLKLLAVKKGISLEELKKDLLSHLESETIASDEDYTHMFQEASKAWGQPLSDAEEETKNLLRVLLKK